MNFFKNSRKKSEERELNARVRIEQHRQIWSQKVNDSIARGGLKKTMEQGTNPHHLFGQRGLHGNPIGVPKNLHHYFDF